LTCTECEAARLYPQHPIFCPRCLFCGGRYLRLIGQQPLPPARVRAWRQKVLADWMRHGHPEAELRRLARLPLAQCLPPTGPGGSTASDSRSRRRRP